MLQTEKGSRGTVFCSTLGQTKWRYRLLLSQAMPITRTIGQSQNQERKSPEAEVFEAMLCVSGAKYI